MSENTKPETAGIPAWLTGELQPVAPVSSEAVAEHIAAEIPGELLGMPSNGDDPEPVADATEAPEQWTPEVETIAEQLIAFKRFWQWPAGTRNEMVAAKECATLFLDLLRNADRS